MRAVDTNILVRLIVDDDAVAVQRARRELANGPWHVPSTVLVELEWVLRSTYELSRDDILTALQMLFALKDAQIAVPPMVLDAYAGGMDFADVVHLAMSAKCAEFITFDRDLVRLSRKLGLMPPAISPA